MVNRYALRAYAPAAVVIASLAAGVGLSGYSNGPTLSAGDATGSPLKNNDCAGCHNGGPYDPETLVELVDATGAALDAYRPGETYTLRITVSGAAEAAAYGLQAVALDSANAQAGTFGEAPEGTRVQRLRNQFYFEHAAPLTDSVAEIAWTAPPEGAGAVTVYAAGNAVNRATSNQGDNVSLAAVSFAEAAPSSLAPVVAPGAWAAYPLAAGTLGLDLPAGLDRGTTLTVHDASGRALVRRGVEPGTREVSVGVSGIVIARLSAPGRADAVRRVFLP